MYYSIDLMSDCSERVPYNIPDYPVYGRKAFLSVYKDMGAPSHWHDDLEFGVVLSGHMTYAVNGEYVHVNSGQGVFINARELHSNFSADGSDCEYICVLIHPSLFCTSPYLKEEYITPLIMNSHFSYSILNPNTVWQADLMEAIQDIQIQFSNQERMLGLTVLRLATQIISALYTHMPCAETHAAQVDRRFATLRNMVGFMQLHYSEKITLADIAFAGNVSVSSCCEIFRQRLCQTPIGYLTRYRIEKGMELLAKPDLSVIDIALAVGFSSASYFTETFRKVHKLTPSEYRKRI